MADGRGISINRLVQEAIAEKAVEERLSRAYDMLAEDWVEADVESFFAIQAEALQIRRAGEVRAYKKKAAP